MIDMPILKKYSVNKLALLVLFLSLLISCGRKKSEVIIPKDKLTAILTDMQLVNSYYLRNYQKSLLHNDSVNFYKSILSEYGYTGQQFDSTMKYYAGKSNDLDLIYEEVITRLSKMVQETYHTNLEENDTLKNLWTKKNYWFLPKDGKRNIIPISIPVKGKGNYSVSFHCKVFPDDKSEKLSTFLYFWYDNKKPGGYKDTLKAVTYEKDARTNIINASKYLSNPKVTHIKGYLLGPENNDKDKHASIYRFTVYFKP